MRYDMTEIIKNDNYAAYLASILTRNGLTQYATEEICSKLSAFCEFLFEQNKLFEH